MEISNAIIPYTTQLTQYIPPSEDIMQDEFLIVFCIILAVQVISSFMPSPTKENKMIQTDEVIMTTSSSTEIVPYSNNVQSTNETSSLHSQKHIAQLDSLILNHLKFTKQKKTAKELLSFARKYMPSLVKKDVNSRLYTLLGQNLVKKSMESTPSWSV